MAKCVPVSPLRRRLLVLALASLVYVPAGKTLAQDRKKQAPPPGGKQGPVEAGRSKPLPPGVVEMREAILAAVRASDIEELRYAIELNELKPELGAPAGADPIAHLRSISADGEGREILTVLGSLLDLPYATLPVGRDIENNLLYVWPYLAEIAPSAYTAAQLAELQALVGPAAADAMRAANRWQWWRLAVGADGTWHTFLKAQ